MKKKVRKNARSAFLKSSPSVAVMIVCLVLGILAGCIFAIYSENAVLTGLVGEDIKRISENGVYDYSFLKTFLNLIKYPVLSFMLAFCAYGVLCVPVLVFFKGFTISLSISSIIGAFGKKGILTAISVFGVQTMVSIPCLIIIASLSFDCSKAFARVVKTPKIMVAEKRPNFPYFVLCFFVCVILLLLTALVDVAVTPTLLSLSLKTIL